MSVPSPTAKVFSEEIVFKVESVEKRYQCNECTRSYVNHKSLEEHVDLKHGLGEKTIRCEICKTPFHFKYTLQKHMAIYHESTPPDRYICEMCSNEYDSYGKLNIHFKRIHTKGRNHVCFHCKKAFYTLATLRMHSKVHYLKHPFVCHICRKRFQTKKDFLDHKTQICKAAPYACDTCQQTFTNAKTLRNHKSEHQEIRIDIFDGRSIYFFMDEDECTETEVAAQG